MIELWRAAGYMYTADDTDGAWRGRWRDRDGAIRQAGRWLEGDNLLESVWLESVEIADNAIVRHEDL